MKKEDKYKLTPLQMLLKRCFDSLLAFIGILFCSPLFFIIYIAVRLEGTGGAVFSQERIGYKGRPFMLYKFRSMRVDAEEDGTPRLYQDNDERLTKVGRFIRTYHLDELPQLWNVLKGDMSFVGYRPERKYFIDRIMDQNPDYRFLYNSRPGVFSYATLYNGYTFTMEKMLKRLEMDLVYLEKYSIFSDLKIILLTVVHIISGKKF